MRQYFAYVDDAGEHWDVLSGCDDVPPPIADSPIPWEAEDEARQRREPYWSYWMNRVPNQNQGYLQVIQFVHYDRILAVDEHGDIRHPGPHLYIDYDQQYGAFDARYWRVIEFGTYPFRRFLEVSEENRVVFFPKELPKPSNSGNGVNAPIAPMAPIEDPS